MKTIQILSVFVLLIFLTNCDKEEEPSISSLSSGPWYYESTDGVDGDACKKQTSIEFTSSGAYLIEAHALVSGSCSQNNLSGTYVVNGNTITVTLFGMDAPSTYVIEDGILSVTGTNLTTSLQQTSRYDKVSG